MSDVVVTVPKSFGLETWIDEGDAAGEPWTGETYAYSTYGHLPDIKPGERVYIVYNGLLRGYAPLIELHWSEKVFGKPFRAPGAFAFIRGGGAVAVTIKQPTPGFRGWRYRWWDCDEEVPFPSWRVP